MSFWFSLILGFSLWISPEMKSLNSEFKIISFEEFETMTLEPSSKLRVYNFWATWCAPCVKEMPYFDRAAANNPNLELIFISMDDGRNPDRVTNFIQKRKVKAPVFLLDDVDFNKWIDKIDPSWSGAIPATLFIKSSGERYFYEGELEEEELNSTINKLLK